MSEPHPLGSSNFEPNRSKSRVASGLAHGVHGWRSPVFLALLSLPMLGGCLFPPSLSSETQDAAVNSPPAILSIRSDQEELIEPGPVVVARSAPTSQLYAELLDTNIDDILYVRMYVNYTVAEPKPARAACRTTASDSPQRTLTCDIKALCGSDDVGKPNLRLEIEVFDRELLDSGTPQFKAMDEGGLTTGRVYDLTCNEGT